VLGLHSRYFSSNEVLLVELLLLGERPESMTTYCSK